MHVPLCIPDILACGLRVMPRAKGKESSNASSSMSDDMIDPAILMQNDFSVQARRPTCP